MSGCRAAAEHVCPRLIFAPGPAAGPGDPAVAVPDAVRLVALPDGRRVYLLGTAHVSSQSERDAHQAVRALAPAGVRGSPSNRMLL